VNKVVALQTAAERSRDAPLVDADFARLVRALLVAIADIGTFDVAYLTTIDWDRHEQVVHFAHNVVEDVAVPEGHRTACPADLSEQVFLGVTRSNDLPTPQPDSHVARRLGLKTYVSVPVVTPSHNLYGTLCGAARAHRDVADATVSAMECFARLLADQMAREHQAATEVRAEWAESQLRVRAQFLAEAEHRLKSPLAVISGWASMLADNDPRLTDAERTRGITAIRDHSDVLLAEVVEMLEESTADVKVTRLDTHDLDVALLVRKAVVDLSHSVPQHRLEAKGAASLHAATDAAVLRQVLAHLIDNAAKYSAADTSIVLDIHEADGWAVIDVRDHGIGIPEGVDVFAAFTKGDESYSRASHGVGLGLHIVRKLVDAVGGDVSAVRNDDVGSTFSVRLPLREPVPA
jgi:K+-sensing histidine kinase KdpD